MNDCVFCMIASKKIPAEIEKETQDMIVFKEKFPKAPIHLLIVPKRHYKDITEADGTIWSEVRDIANGIAREKNLKAFRLVHNAGSAAVVPHMHVHFLGEVDAEREV